MRAKKLPNIELVMKMLEQVKTQAEIARELMDSNKEEYKGTVAREMIVCIQALIDIFTRYSLGQISKCAIDDIGVSILSALGEAQERSRLEKK